MIAANHVHIAYNQYQFIILGLSMRKGRGQNLEVQPSSLSQGHQAQAKCHQSNRTVQLEVLACLIKGNGTYGPNKFLLNYLAQFDQQSTNATTYLCQKRNMGGDPWVLIRRSNINGLFGLREREREQSRVGPKLTYFQQTLLYSPSLPLNPNRT